jgi:hypothetical protein
MSIRVGLLALAIGWIRLRRRRSRPVVAPSESPAAVGAPDDERRQVEMYNRYILAVLAATLVAMGLFATMAHDMLRGIHPGRSQSFLLGLAILVVSQAASPFAFIERRPRWKRRLLVMQIGALVVGCYAMVMAVFLMTMDVAAGTDLPYCTYRPFIVSKVYQPNLTDAQRADLRKYADANHLTIKVCPTVNNSLDDGSVNLP